MTSFVLSFQNIHRHIKPYIELARYDKPIGIWLLLLPAFWGLVLAYEGLPPLKDIALFFLGAALMRGAGCTFNDMCDLKFDRSVERTSNRSLARGALSLKQAFLFLGIQLSLAALILLQLNRLANIMGLIALILALVYPWMKRITYWPQVFLGFTMNWGLLMGFVSTGVGVRPSLLVVYGAAILWTLGYDTIYAFQDIKDDALVGVRASPLVLKDKAKIFLTFCYGFVLLFLITAGVLERVKWSYYFILIIIACHFNWQIQTFREDNSVLCRRLFYSNQWVGVLILIALLWGYWVSEIP